uniref:CocE/NonD family hydrolase C-terminal non-catalytic domain-containing protein n=1 Tax=Klebsiella pneumoniae TaxID=573 RepID=UPI003B97D67A
TAKLVDVQPDGSAFNICDGITRCRFNGPSPHQVTVELWPTSIVIFKGHRMRLEISSSNFPHFDRNLNSGNPAATDSSMVVAQQTICH